MRLLPDTLFGRLTLILLGGLLVAQLVGGAIFLADRGSALFEAGRHHTAQRIVGIVRTLEALPPAQRPTLLAAVTGPSLRVAMVAAPKRPEGDNRVARRIHAMLARGLGADRGLWVHVWPGPKGDAAAPPPPDPQRFRPGGIAPGPPPGWSGNGPDPRFMPGFSGPPTWQDPALYRENRNRWRRFGPEAQGMRMEARVQLNDGVWVGFVQRPSAAADNLPKKVLIAIAVLLIAVLALALFAVRRLTQPLTMLSRAADELGRDIHRPPLAETGPKEVRQAAEAFNTMQTRIRRYVSDRQNMLAAVSHDLKTPITRLRLRTELTEDPVFQEKAGRDLDDMEAIINATLDFMRGDDRREPLKNLDLAALLDDIREAHHELGHDVSVSGDAPPCPARPVALKRALSNLIDNGIRYGGAVTVQLENSPEVVTIRVLDNGPGIPENQLEQVFDPFVRLEASRNRDTGGTGLGLSIARDIARAHGGDLTLHNRPQGGLEARLTLPRQAG